MYCVLCTFHLLVGYLYQMVQETVMISLKVLLHKEVELISLYHWILQVQYMCTFYMTLTDYNNSSKMCYQYNKCILPFVLLTSCSLFVSFLQLSNVSLLLYVCIRYAQVNCICVCMYNYLCVVNQFKYKDLRFFCQFFVNLFFVFSLK